MDKKNHMATSRPDELDVGEGTYKSIFENMRSGVAYQKILTNRKKDPVDFVFMEVNKAFAKIVGMERDEIIGKRFTEVMPAVKSSAFNWITFYGKIPVAGREIKFEQFLQDVKRWYAVSAYSIRKGYFITIYDDITERKKAEESLRAAYNALKATQAQLIQAEKMKAVGRLTTGITHEIKNPLAIIQQGIDYLDKKVDKKGKDIIFALSLMKDATGRASEIMASLLDFSRTTSEKMVQEDLNAIIRNSLLLVKSDIERNHIIVTTDLAKDIPKINLDKISIEQVLINIFMNAINAMQKEGRLKIRTSLKNDEAGQRSAVVIVEDTGCGIPENIIDKVFDPFFTMKEVGQGTGLGLYIVKNIIKAHNADIKIENRKDRKGVRVAMTFNV